MNKIAFFLLVTLFSQFLAACRHEAKRSEETGKKDKSLFDCNEIIAYGETCIENYRDNLKQSDLLKSKIKYESGILGLSTTIVNIDSGVYYPSNNVLDVSGHLEYGEGNGRIDGGIVLFCKDSVNENCQNMAYSDSKGFFNFKGNIGNYKRLIFSCRNTRRFSFRFIKICA